MDDVPLLPKLGATAARLQGHGVKVLGSAPRRSPRQRKPAVGSFALTAAGAGGNMNESSPVRLRLPGSPGVTIPGVSSFSTCITRGGYPFSSTYVYM